MHAWGIFFLVCGSTKLVCEPLLSSKNHCQNDSFFSKLFKQKNTLNISGVFDQKSKPSNKFSHPLLSQVQKKFTSCGDESTSDSKKETNERSVILDSDRSVKKIKTKDTKVIAPSQKPSSPLITQSIRVSRIINFDHFLRGFGLDKDQSNLIAQCVAKTLPTKNFSIDRNISISFFRQGRNLQVQNIHFIASGKWYNILRHQDGHFRLEASRLQFKPHWGKVAFCVDKPIAKMLQRYDVPLEMRKEILRSVAMIGGKNIQKNATLEIVYDLQKSQFPNIMKPGKVHYCCLTYGKKNKKFYQLPSTVGQSGQYVDEKGQLLSRGTMGMPLDGRLVINSPFTYHRFHPVHGRMRAHLGVDFKACHGAVVRSTADGVVEKSCYMGAYGNCVIVRHRNNHKTLYAHLSRINHHIRCGIRVGRGQELGRVGATGTATNPHLHYGLMINNTFVDPIKVKALPLEPLDKKMLKKFQAQKHFIDKMCKKIPNNALISA